MDEMPATILRNKVNLEIWNTWFKMQSISELYAFVVHFVTLRFQKLSMLHDQNKKCIVEVEITIIRLTRNKELKSKSQVTFWGLFIMHSSSCMHERSSLHATRTMPLLSLSHSSRFSSPSESRFSRSSSISSRTSCK